MPFRVSSVLFALTALILAAPCLAGEFGTTRQYFAQYGIGGPAETEFTINVPGETAITVLVELIESDGTLFQMEEVAVGAGASQTVVFSDPQGEVQDGWARLSSDAPFNATVFFQIAGVGNVGVLPSEPGVKFKLFSFVGEATDTGFALANPSETDSTTVTMRTFKTTGELEKEVEKVYGPGEHEAVFVTQDPLGVQEDGLVEFTATNPIILLSLRTDDNLLASTAVIQPQGSSITEVVAGPGLTGGGSTGSILLEVADGGITSTHLANDSVTRAKIAGGAVGLSELAPEVSFGRVQEGGPSPNLILGHPNNSVSGGTEGAVIGGGGWANGPNTASGDYSTIGGGLNNAAVGQVASIGGGIGNRAGIGFVATVGGGESNTASGDRATVPGGQGNTASGAYSFAAGRNASATHDGSFVWSGTSSGGFSHGTGVFSIYGSRNGDASNPGAHVVVIQNLSGGTSTDVLALKMNRNNPSTAANFLTFLDTNEVVGQIDGNGSGGVRFRSSSGDFAEWLLRDRPEEEIVAGDIVGVFQGRVTRNTHGASSLKVVSTAPIVSGNAPPEAEEEQWEEIAFLGQVPVKVRGTVRAGDYILPSGLDDGTGVALAPDRMKLSDFSKVVGRAWESSLREEVKMVRVVVGLTDPNPDLVRRLAEQEARLEALRAELHMLKLNQEKLLGVLLPPNAE